MNKYILVVDDEPDAREILDLVLGTLEVDVVEVPDGREALNAILDQIPLVVISDLEMPKFDGRYVIQELYNHNIDVPIIIFTSHIITPELAQSLGIPVNRMFQKGSVSMTELRRQVMDLIHDEIDVDLSFLQR